LLALGVAKASPRAAQAFLAAGVALGLGFAVTGAGIAFAPSLEPVGAGLLVLGLGTYLVAGRIGKGRGLSRALLLLSSLALFLVLALGATNAFGKLRGERLLSLRAMVALHGGAAFVFALAGALGHFLHALGDGLRRASPAWVLYDGDCGLCNRSVQWLLRRDRAARLRFAPLQGPTAASVLVRHGLTPEAGADFDSVLLVLDPKTPTERVLDRSAAAAAVALRLGGPWPLAAALLHAIPARLRDAAYRFVAQRRHTLAPPACALPSEDDRARFLP
ncbi:MAG: DUF393 domain-containing protein, partial [Planctomycetota bacterium]